MNARVLAAGDVGPKVLANGGPEQSAAVFSIRAGHQPWVEHVQQMAQLVASHDPTQVVGHRYQGEPLNCQTLRGALLWGDLVACWRAARPDDP